MESIQLLKELSENIAPSLAVVFKISYNTGHLLSVWKEANISVIYKKGDKKEPENYYPVSLTNILHKIMKTTIFIRSRIWIFIW